MARCRVSRGGGAAASTDEREELWERLSESGPLREGDVRLRFLESGSGRVSDSRVSRRCVNGQKALLPEPPLGRPAASSAYPPFADREGPRTPAFDLSPPSINICGLSIIGSASARGVCLWLNRPTSSYAPQLLWAQFVDGGTAPKSCRRGRAGG